MTSTNQTPDILPVGFSQLTVETGGAITNEGFSYTETTLPYAISYRSSTQENTEIGLKFGSPGGILIDFKHLILENEPFALSSGVIGGIIGLDQPAAAAGIPIYAGIHINQNTTLYSALRLALMREETVYFSDRDYMLYAAGTASIGLQTGGQRSGIYFEISYGETFRRTFEPNDITDVQNLYFSIAPFYAMRPFTRPRDPWTN